MQNDVAEHTAKATWANEWLDAKRAVVCMQTIMSSECSIPL
jgi:hypothetical protein